MKIMLAAVAALALAATGTAAHAQSGRTATATATATGTVVKPITIATSQNLSFARFVSPSTATTLKVNPGGASGGSESSEDPSGILLSGSPASARFIVGGEPGSAFGITTPAAPIEISSGANKMTVGSFTITNPGGAIPAGQGSTAGFSVGATLSIGANQAAGVYQGSFPVTVSYQ